MHIVGESHVCWNAHTSLLQFILLIRDECNYFPKLHKNSCDYMLIIIIIVVSHETMRWEILVSKGNHKNVAVWSGSWSTNEDEGSSLRDYHRAFSVHFHNTILRFSYLCSFKTLFRSAGLVRAASWSIPVIWLAQCVPHLSKSANYNISAIMRNSYSMGLLYRVKVTTCIWLGK